MNPVVASRSRSSRFRPKRRLNRGALLTALIVQAVLLLGTLFVIVLDTPQQEAPRFEGTQSLQKNEDSFRQQQELSRFMKRVSQPRFAEALSVDALLPKSLPAMPDLPKDAFSFDRADSFLVEDAQAMLQQSGLLDSSLMTGVSSAAAFFGVQDSGERIVIIVNTSASVVRKARNKGVSIEAIQDEVASLIGGLDGGTLFGIVQFSQGSRTFAPYLAPAIARNKEAAANWTRQELKGNPPVMDEELLGHEAGFGAALAMDPDLIFLVTDGSLNRRVRVDGQYKYPEIPYTVLIEAIEETQRERALRARVHAIGFELKNADRAGLQRLTRRFGGTLREF